MWRKLFWNALNFLNVDSITSIFYITGRCNNSPFKLFQPKYSGFLSLTKYVANEEKSNQALKKQPLRLLISSTVSFCLVKTMNFEALPCFQTDLNLPANKLTLTRCCFPFIRSFSSTYIYVYRMFTRRLISFRSSHRCRKQKKNRILDTIRV